MTAPARPANIAGDWATSNKAPLWVAVALYAASKADAQGRAVMEPGELRAAVAPTSGAATISQAISRAVGAGWLGQGSTARVLLVVRRGA